MSRRHSSIIPSAAAGSRSHSQNRVDHRRGPPVRSVSAASDDDRSASPLGVRGDGSDNFTVTSPPHSSPTPASYSQQAGSSLEVVNGAHESPVHHRRTSSQSAIAPPPSLFLLRSQQTHHHPLPGRPARRIRRARTVGNRRFCYRFYSRWLRSSVAAAPPSPSSSFSLWIAVALWYTLGVVSIGTSKILLSDHELGFLVGNVPPIYLTLQQLLIGSTLLRLWIVWSSASGQVQPWPVRSAAVTSTDPHEQHYYILKNDSSGSQWKMTLSSGSFVSWAHHLRNAHPSLVWAALYFGLGFLLTNLGFSGAPASFVETIKASEPITSASVAVWWGIEALSAPEVVSLLAIVMGFVLSTVGNRGSPSSPAAVASAVHSSTATTSLVSCCVVLLSNLCFSFRGLHQKLFRATPEGSTRAMDDVNLQFRMQQLGVVGLALPVLLLEGRSLVRSLWHVFVVLPLRKGGGGSAGVSASLRLVTQYALISLLNGCAFTFYNLSSTYILSRITVVHHAALNCIRRVFAIIVTSVVFHVPMTATGAVGILCSIGGFMSFSHFKAAKQKVSTQHLMLPANVTDLPHGSVR